MHVLASIPQVTDATSMYRGVGPLFALQKAYPSIQFDINANVNWATLSKSDVLFLQRPSSDDHVTAISVAKANKVPVIVDYDDWLLGLPRSNQMHSYYSEKRIQNNVVSIVSKADIVTVSTPYLGELLRDILRRLAKAQQFEDVNLREDKVIVVPNAYDERLLSKLDPDNRPQTKKIVCWRGSPTHDKDLLDVSPEIKRVVETHLSWTYNFIGSPFWLALDIIEQAKGIKPTNIVVTPPIDAVVYFRLLEKIRPSLFIVPLDDNPFNRAKSNIAWIEATHAGAVTIAPDFEEWRKPGIINYRTTKEFGELLDVAIRGAIDLNACWKLSASYINEHLTLSKINELRRCILNTIK